MGIPTVASPFAECNYIIQEGENGFLANSNEEWLDKVSRLFEDAELRQQIRAAGRATILEKYDVPVVAQQLEKCLKEI